LPSSNPETYSTIIIDAADIEMKIETEDVGSSDDEIEIIEMEEGKIKDDEETKEKDRKELIDLCAELKKKYTEVLIGDEIIPTSK
jgi:hypothetical protein